MWGKVILRAVILLLAVFWLGAVWFSFMDPRVFLQKLPTWLNACPLLRVKRTWRLRYKMSGYHAEHIVKLNGPDQN
jgi:hypothetical protein